MKLSLAILASTAVLAASTAAQSPVIQSPTMTGPGIKALSENNNLTGRGMVSNRDTVESVAAQYRAVCASERRTDKTRCARATRMIREAYAEEMARRAEAGEPAT